MDPSISRSLYLIYEITYQSKIMSLPLYTEPIVYIVGRVGIGRPILINDVELIEA